jgi:anti-anti-sigma factor
MPHATGAQSPAPADPVDAETALGVSVSRIGRDVAVTRFFGEVDILTARRCDTVLQRVAGELAAEPVAARRVLVCDLGGVRFLGASGLGALVRADDAARALGVDLVLVGAQRAVRRPLELSGLDRRLRLHARLVDAVPGREGQLHP